MTSPADRLQRILSDHDRRLQAMERGPQLARSSVEIDGEVVGVVDGITQGVQAGTKADQAVLDAQAAYAAAEAAEATSQAASGDALAAQNAADAAAADALAALTQAQAAGTDAGAAQAAADAAQAAANTAKTAADQAGTDAAAADAKAAQAAADAAQALADAAAAKTAADNAKAQADTALSTANGKNAVRYSTAVPDNTLSPGTAPGDLWFRRDGSNIIGQWEWTSANVWESRTLRDEVISSITAGKITTGQLAAGTRIIAGTEMGTHAELTGTGLRVYAEDLLDGIPNEVVRLGTDSNDYFGIADSEGNLVAAVDDVGRASFSGLDVQGDAYFGGRSLNGILDNKSYGMIARGWRTGIGSRALAGQNDHPYLELQCEVPPNRLFRIRYTGYGIQTDANGRVCRIRLRYAGAEGVEVTSTALVDRRMVMYSTLGSAGPDLEHHLASGPTGGEYRFLVTYVAEGGGWMEMVHQTTPFLMVEDLGFYDPDVVGNQGIARSGTATSTVTKKQYVKEYTATAAVTFRGDGSRRTDTTDVLQGQSAGGGGGNGLQKGGWIFPSFTTDLSGSTVNKVEVYAYANHWYYNSGGTARIHLHPWTGSTSFTTYPAGMTHAADSGSWPKPGGRWVTLPSAYYDGFRTGAYRGFGLNPSSTDLLQYGRFNGAGAKVRITYTK